MGFDLNDLREDSFILKLKENKKIIKQIDLAARSGYLWYIDNLKKWQLSFSPIHLENQIIVDLSQKNMSMEEEELKKIVIELGLNGQVAQSQKEKYNFFNKLKEEIYKELDLLIEGKSFFFLITSLTNIEYNTTLSYSIINWISDKKDNDYISDEFQKNLIRTLKSSDWLSNVDLNEIYLTMESRFATDKIAFQKLVQYIIGKDKVKIPQYIDTEKFKIAYEKVLNLSRLLVYLENIHVLSVSTTNKDEALIINEDCTIEITMETLLWNNKDRYINSMKSKNIFENNLKDKSQFDVISSKYYGINYSDFENLFSLTNEFEFKADQYLIGGENIWKNIIMSIFKTSKDGADLLFDILVHSKDENIEKSFFSNTQNRLLRNPLVSIGNYYLCPYGLFIFAMLGHQYDILNGMTQNESMNQEIGKLIKEYDIEFEMNLSNHLIDKFNIEHIRSNVLQKDMVINNHVIELPGQIDILFEKENLLYVMEAKNLRFKYAPKTIENEVDNFLKYKPKSHQYKLHEKVKVIEGKIDEICEYLNLPKNHRIDGVNGVIVTSGFMKGSLYDEILYPIICISELSDYFQNVKKDI